VTGPVWYNTGVRAAEPPTATVRKMARVAITISLELPAITEEMDDATVLGHVDNANFFVYEDDGQDELLPVKILEVRGPAGKAIYHTDGNGPMNQDAIEAACNEACRNIAQLIQSRKESGTPLPTSEVLSKALERLLSHGVKDSDWGDCVDYLQKKASDLRFQKLVGSCKEAE